MTIFYRRMPRFDYIEPRSIQEALEAIGDDSPLRNQVYAGGTDLLPKLKSREIKAPARVINLKGISGLDYVERTENGGLRIGALATVTAVGASDFVRKHFVALAEGANVIASDQIQNRATIVGNVCNAVPSADSPPALLIHDAQVVCVSRSGERNVALRNFFLAPGEIALEQVELVKEIRLPPPLPHERTAYMKLAPRGRMDLAVVGTAASVAVDNGVVKMVRIALGSASPIPMRAPEAEAALFGKPLNEATIAEAARLAAEHSRTRSSHRASGEYRKMMLEVLVKRVLTKLAD